MNKLSSVGKSANQSYTWCPSEAEGNPCCCSSNIKYNFPLGSHGSHTSHISHHIPYLLQTARVARGMLQMWFSPSAIINFGGCGHLRYLLFLQLILSCDPAWSWYIRAKTITGHCQCIQPHSVPQSGKAAQKLQWEFLSWGTGVRTTPRERERA